MDPPKFLLNPDAAPFIPNFGTSGTNFREENIIDIIFCDSTNHENTEEHEIFHPALKPCTDNVEELKVSDQDCQRRIDHASEPMDYLPPYKTTEIGNQESKDHVPPRETVGIEKQDMEDSSQHEIELLSYLFPNFSLQSIGEVYDLCGNDMVDTAIALEDLEGHDNSLISVARHSAGTASSSSQNTGSSDPVSR